MLKRMAELIKLIKLEFKIKKGGILMLDKDIELQKEQLQELELLKKKIKDLEKQKKKLKKLNDAQARIINKSVNHEFLRKYIKDDELISKIVEMLEFCSFKVHRDTFKNFLTNEYELEVDDMKDHELEAAAINFYRFQHVTTKTINKKLEELKILKLIDFNEDNYYIKSTDLLITIRNKEYKRSNNSIKDEQELIMDTEDKLFAYRFTLENDYLTENKELIDKFKVFNSIYVVDQNILVLGRRCSEDLLALRRRLFNMIISDLVDTSNFVDKSDNRYQELLKQSEKNIFNLPGEHEVNTHIPIVVYISKKMKLELRDIECVIKKFSNPVEIVRY